MKDSLSSNSPHPGHLFDVPDEALSVELRNFSGKKAVHQPFEELLARHWRPVHEYAELCAVSGHTAGILASAAFTRVFVDTLRLTGPSSAWRPELLVTVHRIAEEWATDRRRASLHRGLRMRGDQADPRLAVPDNRRLVHRAFQRLPEPARCLLWHVEVDAENLAVPAALLGVGQEKAAGQLELARTRFREACVQAHRDLAPYESCLQFSRLLDISIHRGGAGLVPDLQRHIAKCDHCRYAAEQLDHSGDRLGALIAEAVLVWEARAYLDSRPARRAARDNDAAAAQAGRSGGQAGRRHGGRRRRPGGLLRGRGRPGAAGATALGVGGVVLVVAAVAGLAGLLSDGGTDDRASAGVFPGASAGTSAAGSASGSGAGSASPTASSSGTGTGRGSGGVTADPAPGGGLRGRLRNQGSGLCVDLAGRGTVLGTTALTAVCDSGTTQFWTYERDGLLRSVAEPSYCLNSHRGAALELGLCTASFVTGAEDVRYDLTLTGDLVPRWNQQLAVAPDSGRRGAGVVLAPRDGRSAQRWSLDASVEPSRFRSVALGRPPVVRVALNSAEERP
ncbi:ricin-type beta-trefoil lectin domain protein [Streptomyces sp. MI02-7b]|uniref:ricin-type beta-trefoil lectin domain protein n=1 Tax=Streptomyces sp. MI02-7b TaxID=462941 RepID=UPI0029AAF565|nr:ricin-type beta-trefoil lectin domain protein [Streptomyces sp. MI02-7b]MDX3076566.1 ricin-type beta-trefoil lectin domain protein [Streptomyces sp. MI02-7b]